MKVASVAVLAIVFMAACVHKPFVTLQPHVPGNSCDGIEMPLDFSVYSQIKHYLDDSAVYYYVVLNRTMPQDQPLDSGQFLQVKCWLKDGYPEN